MTNNDRVTGPSGNYSRIVSSSVHTISSSRDIDYHIKIDKEDDKHQASEITQKKENRKETRKED